MSLHFQVVHFGDFAALEAIDGQLNWNSSSGLHFRVSVVFPFYVLGKRSMTIKALITTRASCDVAVQLSSSHPLHTMNSSYDTDISTSRLRPATFQHGSTRYYGIRTWAFASPVFRDWLRSPPTQLQGTSRPLSYSELIERTEHHWQSLKNDSKTLKGWLRLAESIHRSAKSFHKQGVLDSAFVEYKKASTIVLEKIPAHPDYGVLLSTKHRDNINLVSHFYPIGPVHVPLADALTNASSVFFMVSINL